MEVRSFLGFANYYHWFLKGYASIVHPLYELVSGENVSKKNRPVQWTKQCQEAFDKIKGPLLHHPPSWPLADFKQPFILHTHTSGIGLDAVLYQTIDGKECVIGYGSCSLNKGESCYPAHKLEFLALKLAVTTVFHKYLFGNHFTVKSDNNSLTYVLTMA